MSTQIQNQPALDALAPYRHFIQQVSNKKNTKLSAAYDTGGANRYQPVIIGEDGNLVTVNKEVDWGYCYRNGVRQTANDRIRTDFLNALGHYKDNDQVLRALTSDKWYSRDPWQRGENGHIIASKGGRPLTAFRIKKVLDAIDKIDNEKLQADINKIRNYVSKNKEELLKKIHLNVFFALEKDFIEFAVKEIAKKFKKLNSKINEKKRKYEENVTEDSRKNDLKKYSEKIEKLEQSFIDLINDNPDNCNNVKKNIITSDDSENMINEKEINKYVTNICLNFFDNEIRENIKKMTKNFKIIKLKNKDNELKNKDNNKNKDNELKRNKKGTIFISDEYNNIISILKDLFYLVKANKEHAKRLINPLFGKRSNKLDDNCFIENMLLSKVGTYVEFINDTGNIFYKFINDIKLDTLEHITPKWKKNSSYFEQWWLERTQQNIKDIKYNYSELKCGDNNENMRKIRKAIFNGCNIVTEQNQEEPLDNNINTSSLNNIINNENEIIGIENDNIENDNENEIIEIENDDDENNINNEN